MAALKGLTVEEAKKVAEKKAEYARFLWKGDSDISVKDVLVKMRKKFGSGLDQAVLCDMRRSIRKENGKVEKPAKLAKEPKKAEVEVSPALPADVAELIKVEMKKAKETGAVFLVDLAKLEEDIKRLNQMADVMRPHGYAKMVVTADGFEIDQVARKIQGKL